jgi:predicted RND superfamily exporter protein
MDNKSKPEEINDIVEIIQFLNKDYMQDVDSVKKFTDYISERVKRSISKTVKKVDFILNKMQSYIKELDFTMFQHFKDNGMAAGESRDKCKKIDI